MACGTVVCVDNHNETELAAALRARGGRVTPQRLAIARVVREQDGHVTAEDVFGEVSARMPGVSLPTVYATLELLEQLGLVRRVPAASGAVLFDSRTDEHDHLVCRRCGAVADLETETDRVGVLAAAARLGFHADDAQVVVTGLCADCAAEQAAAAAHN
jgi:Fe2+ or Zn2+ uptake regulation protein